MALGSVFYDFRSSTIPVSDRGDYKRRVVKLGLDEACCAALCASIVEAATADLDTLNAMGEDSAFANGVRIRIYRKELYEFFRSDFFELMMDFITQGTYSGADARKGLGIPNEDTI